MCGFCIETGMIIPALANHLLGEPFPANTWLAVRLQEDELSETLFEEARAENLLPELRARLLADFARDGYKTLPSDLIDTLANLSAELPPTADDPCWHRLFDPQTLRSAEDWQATLQALPTESARTLLETHLDRWAQRPEEASGNANAVEDAPETSETFSADEAAVLGVALGLLGARRVHLDLIERLTVSQPVQVPFFIDPGLWLQRRACWLMAGLQGMDFLLDHLTDLRLELVAYVLLRVDWTEEDKKRLRDAIGQTAPCFGMGMDTGDVLAISDGTFEIS